MSNMWQVMPRHCPSVLAVMVVLREVMVALVVICISKLMAHGVTGVVVVLTVSGHLKTK